MKKQDENLQGTVALYFNRRQEKLAVRTQAIVFKKTFPDRNPLETQIVNRVKFAETKTLPDRNPLETQIVNRVKFAETKTLAD